MSLNYNLVIFLLNLYL